MSAGRDEDLVRRAREGDARAFEALVAAYEHAIFNLTLRMTGDREDAQDLTQVVFLKAWRGLGGFDDTRRFFSWIYRIAIHEAINLRQSRRPREPLDERLVAGGETPDAVVHRHEMSGIVEKALLELSTDLRQVIVLRHLQHLSYVEIGAILELPEKTVKSRLFTARRQLAEALRRRGVTQP